MSSAVLPVFVRCVGNNDTEASYLQITVIIDGVASTFRQVLDSPSWESVQRAWRLLVEEIEHATNS